MLTFEKSDMIFLFLHFLDTWKGIKSFSLSLSLIQESPNLGIVNFHVISVLTERVAPLRPRWYFHPVVLAWTVLECV